MSSVFYQVDLNPIEPILFGGTRASRMGEDHLIRDQEPQPQVIFGAIGANIATKAGAWPNRSQWDTHAKPYLGDFVPQLDAGDESRAELYGYCYKDFLGHEYFPLPRHVTVIKEPQTLSTLPLPILEEKETVLTASSQSEFTHVPFRDPEDSADDEEVYEEPLLVSADALKEFLCGQSFGETLREAIAPTEEIFLPEPRSGLGMDVSRGVTQEGLLFTRPYRRFRSNVNAETGQWATAGIRAWFKTLQRLPTDWANQHPLTFLGGDRGRAWIHYGDPQDELPWVDMLEEIQKYVNEASYFLIYLLTPAVRELNWPHLHVNGNNFEPIAAFTDKEIPLSGWNASASPPAPRPKRTLIPAGSVFVYKWPEGSNQEQRQQLLRDLWLAPICPAYRNAGFGRILTGVWS